MSGTETPGNETAPQGGTKNDWALPAMLAAIVGFVIFVVAVSAAFAASDDASSTGGDAEAWTRCMRSEGVQVPLVEELDNGSIRVTFYPDHQGHAQDRALYTEAFDACLGSAPEGVRDLVRFLERPPWER